MRPPSKPRRDLWLCLMFLGALVVLFMLAFFTLTSCQRQSVSHPGPPMIQRVMLDADAPDPSQVPDDNLGWPWCQYIEFASVAHCWIGCTCYHCPFNVVGVGGGRQVTEQDVEAYHEWIANSEPFRADLTNTGSVDTEDILILLNAWGGSGAADITCSGEVGVDDLLILLNNWGTIQ